METHIFLRPCASSCRSVSFTNRDTHFPLSNELYACSTREMYSLISGDLNATNPYIGMLTQQCSINAD